MLRPLCRRRTINQAEFNDRRDTCQFIACRRSTSIPICAIAGMEVIPLEIFRFYAISILFIELNSLYSRDIHHYLPIDSAYAHSGIPSAQ